MSAAKAKAVVCSHYNRPAATMQFGAEMTQRLLARMDAKLLPMHMHQMYCAA
jgi:hypothetical protein